MAITTSDGYIAATKQLITYQKPTFVTTVAATEFATVQLPGNPGAPASVVFTGTPTGQIIDDTVAGYPPINTFGGGNTGYLTRVMGGYGQIGRMKIYDILFGVNISLLTLATNTLSGQPSYSARVPGGTDFSNLSIIAWVTTAVSATATTLQVNYTNQAGTTGRASATTSSLSGFSIHRIVPISLQSGDSGVQKIESVTVGGTVATTGVVNVCVVRPLWQGRFPLTNAAVADTIDKTGMPQVFDTSALFITTVPDSTAGGISDFQIEIANG